MTITLTLSEIGLFLVFIVLTAFVIYLFRLAIATRETLKKAQALIDVLHLQAVGIGEQSERLFQKANEISTNLENKLINADPLFQAMEDLGIALTCKTEPLKQRSIQQQERLSSIDQKLNATDLIDCSLSILRIWSKIKKER